MSVMSTARSCFSDSKSFEIVRNTKTSTNHNNSQVKPNPAELTSKLKLNMCISYTPNRDNLANNEKRGSNTTQGSANMVRTKTTGLC